MEGPLDLGLKRERRLMPILPRAGFFAGIAGLAWRRGVGGVDGVTEGREGAGFAGGTTELGGVTGMRVAAVEGEVDGEVVGCGGGVERDGDGIGGEGGVERGGGGGFP